MADIYVFDSSFLIPLFRRRPAAALAQRFFQLVDSRQGAINPIIELELLTGTSSPEALAETRSRLGALRLLGFTSKTWDAAASTGMNLRRLGLPLPVPDLLVVASTVEHEATLIHADSDFDRVQNQIPGLKLESYVGHLTD